VAGEGTRAPLLYFDAPQQVSDNNKELDCVKSKHLLGP
jgi:hypothetical protein